MKQDIGRAVQLFEAAAAQEIILPPALADRMVTNTRAMGAYHASTVIDFQLGRPMELESLFLVKFTIE